MKKEMTKVYHFNCLDIRPAGSKAVAYCLLLEDDAGLAILDSGIGVEEVRNPEEHFGSVRIQATGFKFNTDQPLVIQIASQG